MLASVGKEPIHGGGDLGGPVLVSGFLLAVSSAACSVHGDRCGPSSFTAARQPGHSTKYAACLSARPPGVPSGMSKPHAS